MTSPTSSAQYSIFIRGIPSNPSVTQVNVRSGASTSHTLLFKIDVGTVSKQLTDIESDEGNQGDAGKIYLWFNVTFSDGRSGWVRDDLLDVQGDLSTWGYGVVTDRSFAFSLTRSTTTISPPPPQSPTPVLVTATPGTGCIGTANSSPYTRIRSASTVTAGVVALLLPGSTVEVLNVTPGQDADHIPWVDVQTTAGNGLIRSDLLSYSGPCTPFGLSGDQSGLLPPPVTPYVLAQKFVVGGHRGWDLAGAVGTPVLAWNEGVVMRAMPCTKCTADHPSFASAGIQPNTSAFSQAYADPAWGYGFGNNVIVRYPYSLLPDSGKKQFDAVGLTNGWLYAIYGHLSALNVSVGQTVSSTTQVGLRGQTGNASGPHLHLELHGSMNNNLTDVYGQPLFDPQYFVHT